MDLITKVVKIGSYIEIIKSINYFNIPINKLSFKRDKKCFKNKMKKYFLNEKILGIVKLI